ncbi:MAG: diaminopimelate epimerase [Prevotella sp.]|nr:diaminopimelate epimerase [Prevotella sp.]
MSQTIHFTKMHGAGNDYIYLFSPGSLPFEALSRLWSDRHKGVGSDGLVVVDRAKDASDADFSMRIFNADGSEAMMCGNASRCVGKYLYEKRLTDKTRIRLQTRSGVKVLQLHLSAFAGNDGHRKVEKVTVDMGMPQPEDLHPTVPSGAEAWLCSQYVSMGNPHYVVFLRDVEAFDVAGEGALLEVNAAFPDRCNIEFATILAAGRPANAQASAPHAGAVLPGKVRMRVWERGSGITEACGTGACATAVAATKLGLVAGRTADIVCDGGTLSVEWRASDGHVYMSGPAAFVFEGEVEVP